MEGSIFLSDFLLWWVCLTFNHAALGNELVNFVPNSWPPKEPNPFESFENKT
jgi:hypothetical protein